MKFTTVKHTLDTSLRYRSFVSQVTLLLVIVSVCQPSLLPSESPDQPKPSLKETASDALTPPQIVAGNYESETTGENAIDRNYIDFDAYCAYEKILIKGRFKNKFKGRIYAVDYVEDPECGSITSNITSENVTFSLPLGQCGVRMTVSNDNLENDLRHSVVLYIQYSAFLQQIIDDKVAVSCIEAKKPVEENVTSNSIDESQNRRSRQGRRFKESTVKTGSPSTAKIGEAWMEILSGKDPSPKTKNEQPVQVGEDLTLVVSTKVARGYDARVVNCTAHDGSRTTNDGNRVQQILDSAGCSIDRGLVPNFRRRRMPVESRSQLTLHFATFPAFKFPERDHIHVRCSVAYCQGPCPQESCDSGTNHYGSWKDKYGRVADILVKTSDIVNAVEVISPELEGVGGHHYERHQSSNSGVGSAAPTTFTSETAPGRHQQLQFSDTQSSLPLTVTQHQPPNSAYSNGIPNLNSNYHYSPHAINGQAIYANNQIPQGTQNISPTVCVSPGTVILALVILGVVLVISATATLWLALKRSDAKKYEQQKMSSFNSSPAPSPYYRFNHW